MKRGFFSKKSITPLSMAPLSTALVDVNEENPNNKYKPYRKIPVAEAGKNEGITIMYSLSRRDPNIKKLWVYKPLYNKNHANKYDLDDAAKEVFHGALAVALFDNRAAKTKFGLNNRGTFSRILGDDDNKVMDILNFLSKLGDDLPTQAQETLLATIIYSVIIGDRDLRIENLILTLSDNYATSIVYGIDHEFAGAVVEPDRLSLQEVMEIFVRNPHQIIRILLDKSFPWNLKGIEDNLSESALEQCSKRLLGNITREKYIATLQKIVTDLSADDFKICEVTKEKISKSLSQQAGIYSDLEIDWDIGQTMQISINTIKENTKIVQDFLATKTSQRMSAPKCEV